MVDPGTDGPGPERHRRGDGRSDRAPTAAEARAEVEARRAEVRAEREAAFAAAYGDRVPGRSVLVGSWSATVVFVVVAVVAAVAVGSADAVFVTTSLLLFLAGCVLFALDLVIAAGRSRDVAMGIGGLFFLAGSAPSVVQRHLLGSLVTQVVVALVAAGVGFARIDDRQLNALAFGVLVPILGVAACGLWAVRWGMFPDHAVPASTTTRRSGGPSR